MRVDFLIGAVLGVLGSVLSFDTVDGKILSSCVDNSACELCSDTIQPFLN